MQVRFSSFAGRQGALEALDSARREAAGRRRLIIQLVGGDAGIGKSRLLREFYANLPRRHFAIATALCHPYGGKPFGPVLQILQKLAPHSERSVANAKEKSEFFEVIADGYRSAASRRSAIIFLEDLHWADAGTIEMLGYLARTLEGVRLLIVATYRSEELHEGHPLMGHFAHLLSQRVVRSMQLEPLADSVLLELIDRERGSVAHLSGQIIRSVLMRAEGSPFFTEELLTSLVRNPHEGEPEIPLSVRASVRQRLLALGVWERAILEHASILGRSFDLGLLCNITESDAVTVLNALQKARALQLVDEDCESEGFHFRHALTREAISGELLGAQRRAVHARIVEALEASSDAGADGNLTNLAYHAHEARLTDKSLRYNERAGAAAMGVFAYDEAIGCFARALQAAGSDRSAAARMERASAAAHFRAGSPDVARAAYERSLEAYIAAAEYGEAAAVSLDLARSYYNVGDADNSIRVLRAALNFPLPADDSARAMLHALGAAIVVRQHDVETARFFLGGVNRKVRDREPIVAAYYYNAAGTTYAIEGNLDGCRDAAEASVSAGERTKNDAVLYVVLETGAVNASHLGQGALANTYFERAIDIARRLKVGMYVAAAAVNYSFDLYLRGDLEKSLAQFRLASSIAHNHRNVQIGQAYAGLFLGSALCDEALIDGLLAEDLMEAAFATGLPGLYASLGAATAQALAERRRMDEAQHVLAQTLDRTTGCFQCAPLLAAVAQFGSDEHIVQARALLAGASHQNQQGVGSATRALFEALVADRSGDATTAKTQGLQAAVAFEAVGWKTFAALALEVSQKRDEAMAIYAAIGHERGIRRLSRAPAGRAHAIAKDRSRLTKRQSAIADLVKTGRSNRAIAQKLGISEKTVESHLSSIFGKLEIASRAQLAAHAASNEPSREAP
ncbi:MAG: AAA family ATPase [Candidatus Cybelea sp.]